MMRLPDTYSLYFNKRKVDYIIWMDALSMTSGRECPYYFGRGERDFICPYNMKRVGQRLKRVDKTRRDDERWTDLWPLDL